MYLRDVLYEMWTLKNLLKTYGKNEAVKPDCSLLLLLTFVIDKKIHQERGFDVFGLKSKWLRHNINRIVNSALRGPIDSLLLLTGESLG